MRVPDSVNGVVRSEWSYPEFVAWKNALREWEEKSGSDLLFGQELVGNGYEKVTLLLTGGLAIERLDPDGGFTWDSPPANLMERFALLTPRYQHSPINETIEFNNINFRPGLFLFQTREGNRGLLQIILDKSKIGQGFKVRYMLVKMADAAPSSDRSSNHSSPPDNDRMGTLGYSLGTYLTIGGVRAEEGKVGTQTLLVDTIGGNKQEKPIGIWIENVELPKGERCVLKGYETGRMIGVPDELLRATGYPRPQAGWQFRHYFIATSVEQPENLKRTFEAPKATDSNEPPIAPPPPDQGSSATPAPAPAARETELEAQLARTTEKLHAAMNGQAVLAKDLAIAKQTADAKNKLEEDLAEKRAAQLVGAIRAPLELVGAHAYKDGGSLGFVFKDSQSRVLEFCEDRQEVHNPPNRFYNRLFVGAKAPGNPDALLTAIGGKTEKLLIPLLKQWWNKHINLSNPEQPTMLVNEVIILLEKRNSTARLQFRLMADAKDAEAEPVTRRYTQGRPNVSREVLLDETSVSSATVVKDDLARSVLVKFTADGAKKFAEITKANVGKQIAIVFDHGLIAEPTINAGMNDFSTDAQMLISGNFAADEADRVAATITTAIQTAAEKSKPSPIQGQ